ncbi:MAG: hypothetical protein IIY28_11585, partial [Lachnospiraceae bacterium]|nr:hypothetical protein [Lachnospiraceae bacterium]
MDRQEEKEIQKKLEEFEKELFEGDLFDENPAGSAADQTPPEDEALDETDTIPFDEVILKSAEQEAQRIREEEEKQRQKEAAAAAEATAGEDDFDETDTLPFDEVVAASAGAELYDDDYFEEQEEWEDRERPARSRRRVEEGRAYRRRDEYDDDEDYDYKEGSALGRFFSHLTAIDVAIGAAAAAIVVVGLIFALNVNANRKLEAKAAEFTAIGTQIEDAGVIGSDT